MMKQLWIAFVMVCTGVVSHAQDAAFDVWEYRVQGTTLLPVDAVEKAVYPHLGEKKTLADVERAREALERAYHGAGYLTVLVDIPQQKVDDGIVSLAVTEAPVDRLRVVGTRYFSANQIRAGVPELAEGNVPNFNEMQTELAQLNRSPDRRIAPVLRPGKTPGTVEVDLKVQDQLPLHGSVEMNDRHSEGTSPNHVSAALRWDNLWGRQHSLGLAYSGVPASPAESRVVSASYNIPLDSGNFWSFYAVRSDSDIAAVGSLNVIGKGVIYGARYIATLPARTGFVHTANMGLDHKHFDQTINQIGGGGFNTPITYLPLTTGWDGTWFDEQRTTKLGVSFNFHLHGTVGNEAEFADKGFKRYPGYSFLRGNLAHTEKWASGWGATVRTNWQVAGQALISNEQFSIGGVESVRGYFEGAAAGDTGISMALETKTPSFAKHLSSSIDDAHLLVFVDGGTVQVRDPLGGQQDRYTLVGSGVGLRLRGWQGASAALDWAVAANSVGKTRAGDSRLYFKLGYEW